MTRRVKSHSREIEDTLRALRRAARRALELGLQTGTRLCVEEQQNRGPYERTKAIEELEIKALVKIAVLQSPLIDSSDV